MMSLSYQGQSVPVEREAQKHETGRVLAFPARLSFAGKRVRRATGEKQGGAGKAGEVADLRRYEQGREEPDDFPQRMKVNALAFAFIVLLTIAGVWLVDQLALLRKQSDCIANGRKNCVDVETPLRDR